MKLFKALIILFFLINCSFDDKTGIWKNNSQVNTKKNQPFEEFKSLSNIKEKFNKEISLDTNFNFNNTKSILNYEWNDVFYTGDNNFKNFNYDNQNKLLFKSRKLTNYRTDKYILYENNNLITSDIKGNIIVYSINENKELLKFNFYKKRYKKINKILNLIVNNNIIYASDNLGFVYALNYKTNKILWAKNYKIPFRSNIKISNNKIILANQNNTLYFISITNGEILKTVPTEESPFKKKFKNNLAVYKDNIIFLNTYGSLYSLNIEAMKINWFTNLNPTIDINPSNIFTSNQIIVFKNKIFVPVNNNFYIIDQSLGSVIFKKN
jgi:outer membrane protein assembly factor BamB